MKQESGEKDMTTDSREKLINENYIIDELEKKDILIVIRILQDCPDIVESSFINDSKTFVVNFLREKFHVKVK